MSSSLPFGTHSSTVDFHVHPPARQVVGRRLVTVNTFVWMATPTGGGGGGESRISLRQEVSPAREDKRGVRSRKGRDTRFKLNFLLCVPETIQSGCKQRRKSDLWQTDGCSNTYTYTGFRFQDPKWHTGSPSQFPSEAVVAVTAELGGKAERKCGRIGRIGQTKWIDDVRGRPPTMWLYRNSNRPQ